MGRDKALIEMDGTANAQRLAQLLRALGADPVVFVGDQRWPQLKGGHWVGDRQANAGPLSGLLGFRDSIGAIDAVVLATDLFQFNREALTWLLQIAQANPERCVWPKHVNRNLAEPLASFYAQAAWPYFEAAWRAGKRALVHTLPAAAVATPWVPAALTAAFQGFNTPEELSGS